MTEHNQETNEKIVSLKKADSLAVAKTIVQILDAKKARDIRLYHVEAQTVVADYYIVCDGNVRNQLHAMAGELEEKLAEAGVTPGHIDGRDSDSWILLDYGSVLVHLMLRDTREFYHIEKLWDASCQVDISGWLIQD